MFFNEDNKNKIESIYFKVMKDGGVGSVIFEFIIYYLIRLMDVDYLFDDFCLFGFVFKLLDVY